MIGRLCVFVLAICFLHLVCISLAGTVEAQEKGKVSCYPVVLVESAFRKFASDHDLEVGTLVGIEARRWIAIVAEERIPSEDFEKILLVTLPDQSVLFIAMLREKAAACMSKQFILTEQEANRALAAALGEQA